MSDIGKLEGGVAIGLVGAGIFNIHNMYTQHAGSLSDFRSSSRNDVGLVAKLTDADCITGATALLVGTALAVATGRGWPVALSIAGFLLVAGYYHKTLAGPVISTTADDGYNNQGKDSFS